MSSRFQTWMSVALAVACAGCATRGDVEMLESELRRHEQAQEELAEQLASANQELKVARADAIALRRQLHEAHQVSLAPEQADILYRAEGIKFNALLTAGLDRDGQSGDEGISVLVQPVDAQGDLVKLAGGIELELLDLTQPADDQRIGQWVFSPDEVREHWHRGFLSAGYLFQLDWQRKPSASELTLHARLVPPDGRRFDATTQIKVQPPGKMPAPPVVQADYKPSAKTPVTPGPTPRPHKYKPATTTGKTALESDRPRLTPAKKSGSSSQVPQATSDNWTEESIPRLR